MSGEGRGRWNYLQYETRSDILQGQALFRGVKRKKEKKKKWKKNKREEDRREKKDKREEDRREKKR